MIFILIKCLKLLLLLFIANKFYYKNNLIIKSKSYKNSNLNNKNNNLFNNKFIYLKKTVNKVNNLKIIDIRYWYSFKYKIIKIEYNIGLYDEEENLILPSDISLYNNISILCNIEILYYDISIDSLANIKSNKYFNCIEFFNMNERIKLGIKIYNIYDNNIYNYFLLFTDEFIKYNIIELNFDRKFNSLVINNEFNLLLKAVNSI